MGDKQTMAMKQMKTLDDVLDPLLNRGSPFEAYKTLADKYVAQGRFS